MLPALCLLLSFVINAQDTTDYKIDYSLDQVNVVANKLNVKLKDAATRVNIISSDKIKKVNGTRLAEVLSNTSEVFIKSYGLTSSLQTVSINGLGGEHTLVLYDGIKLNSYQNSGLDLSLVSLDNIERIEIVNNGLSSVYGSNAMGGVINIVSKNRLQNTQQKSMGINASISSGSFNSQRYSLGLNRQYNKFNASITYSREESDGDYEYHYDNGISTETKRRENASYSLYDITLNSQYIINTNNFVRFISTYTNQDKNVPGIETGTPAGKTRQKEA